VDRHGRPACVLAGGPLLHVCRDPSALPAEGSGPQVANLTLGVASAQPVELEGERALLCRNNCGQSSTVGHPMHPRRLAGERVEDTRPTTEPHPDLSCPGNRAVPRALPLARIGQAAAMSAKHPPPRLLGGGPRGVTCTPGTGDSGRGTRRRRCRASGDSTANFARDSAGADSQPSRRSNVPAPPLLWQFADRKFVGATREVFWETVRGDWHSR
jgi:hypothetical protein